MKHFELFFVGAFWRALVWVRSGKKKFLVFAGVLPKPWGQRWASESSKMAPWWPNGEVSETFFCQTRQPLGGLENDQYLSWAPLLRADRWPPLNLLHRKSLQLWKPISQLLSWVWSNGWYFQKPQPHGDQWPKYQEFCSQCTFWAISIFVAVLHRTAVNEVC